MSQPSFQKSFTSTYRSGTYASISPTRPEVSAKSRTIVITAGHTGIGFAIACSFAAAGASNIIIVGRRETVLRAAVQKLSVKHPGTNLHYFAVSITAEDQVEQMFASIRRNMAEPDILITSAAYFASGATGAASVASTPLKEMTASFETNVVGNLSIVQAFLGRATQDHIEKTIIDVSTCTVHLYLPQAAGAYSASKLAFTKLLMVLHDEARTAGQKLRVHSFHPGAVFTEAVADAGHRADVFPFDDIELPGHFAVWLASPEAEFLAGRFVWANWDIGELIERKEDILRQNLLRLGLVGKAEWDTKLFV
ncbi:hypothetical protein LTR62_002326 [Meristemomyces frigidus]|uniref:Uncharacterized protein n=1 Tax=Meristemomyces frigidus TaxID=1508187 RepID=A0AAN7T8Q6_9PEZI|nr:hypothetical protein LTR62_002326 [Meristemomyces frigidus]